MVSITLSVPEDTRNLMKKFPEMNWSGFVRNKIIEKVRNLEKFEDMKKGFLIKEKPVTEWSVKLQKSSRNGRLAELKKKGLI
ncbi:MAG: hypothetical protein KKF44_05735 [Nanoarchaeota archaeon]|nr:hypothetical protein [Nanoarchaeota archaeon]